MREQSNSSRNEERNSFLFYLLWIKAFTFDLIWALAECNSNKNSIHLRLIRSSAGEDSSERGSTLKIIIFSNLIPILRSRFYQDISHTSHYIKERQERVTSPGSPGIETCFTPGLDWVSAVYDFLPFHVKISECVELLIINVSWEIWSC